MVQRVTVGNQEACLLLYRSCIDLMLLITRSQFTNYNITKTQQLLHLVSKIRLLSCEKMA